MYRRVVASPRPQRIFETRPVTWLLEKGTVMICAGGGGIPTAYDVEPRKLSGVEAVIDKDLCSALLVEELQADLLVIATDVDAAYVDWNKPTQKAVAAAHPDEIEKRGFAAGSMGPKVQAACEFARNTGRDAVIGALRDIVAITGAPPGRGSAFIRRSGRQRDARSSFLGIYINGFCGAVRRCCDAG
jgi:carbamate kinase